MTSRPVSATAALEHLRQGNARFVASAAAADASHDRRAELVRGQAPFAIVLGCSESRAPAEVEDLMAPRRYLVFFLLGGLAATAAQVAAGPTSMVPNLGASGAIAAVMGAFLVTYPRDRIRSLLVSFVFVRVTYIPAALLIGVWFLLQFVNLGSLSDASVGGVAYAAHVGGFIFGAVTARLFEDQRRLAG